MTEQIPDNSSDVAEYVQGNVWVLESVVDLLVQEDLNYCESQCRLLQVVSHQ